MAPRSLPAAALLALAMTAPASAATVRPGPALLYAKAPVVPQLQNTGIWRAAPILVSGATAYRRGEFLYQDYLYDDNGARQAPDPGDPRTAGNLFSKQNGTYTYPTDPLYAANAADLVEFRVKPLAKATAFRATLNTLKDPSLVALTIALGSTKSPSRPLPFGANVSAPADVVVTVHPKGKLLVGAITDAKSGNSLGTVPVKIDRTRRQIEVRVPHTAWSPGKVKRRVAAGVGLWDAAAGKYLLPQAAADATHPGGGGTGTAPAAFFNVAFRTHEDVQSVTDGTSVITAPAWWRDRRQAAALTLGDISRFSVDVDFAKLAKGATDNRAVPKTGPMDRIYGSRFEKAQGNDFSQNCLAAPANCPAQYQGRLQPYAIYVPRKKMATAGYGMTLLLHSLGAMYNQYLGSRNQSQFGERGNGSIVITPEGRGPDEFYENYGAADTFEVWADAARHYKIDKPRTVITGYSMGGIGTFKLGAQYPDLFARAQPTVGDESTNEVLASLRNVPVLMWNTNGDELVNEADFTQTAQALDALGYRYELDAYQPCANAMCSPLFPNHLELAINDQFAPAAAFLDDATVDRNPSHVTYVREPSRDHPELQLVADHAYWVSALKLRDATSRGQIDAISHGAGGGEPVSTPLPSGTGTLTGGNMGALTFVRSGRTWTTTPGPAADRLEITATNLSAATIDVKRASLTCNAKVDITSDGPIDVTLAGCNKVVKGGT